MSHGGLGIEHLQDVEPIGPGEGGDLYTATDLKLDRKVAVRVLPVAANEGERGRILDQARALARWSRHRNIVTVYDAGVAADGNPYLVTELIEGPNLARRIEADGPMPWPEAVALTLQLADGLEQVHRAGGRHRDLRPENIILTGSTATLTEVGLLPGPCPGPESTAGLANQAPETLTSDGDERSDLYSLTSILYFMLDGRAPFWRPADTVEALRARLLNQPAPPLEPDLVPPALAVFVAAGLSADPLDRPQHIGEFATELRLIAEGRVTGSTPSVLHATGSVPAVPTITPIDVSPTTVSAFPSPAFDGSPDTVDSSRDSDDHNRKTPETASDAPASPSWTFDTAELTVNDGGPPTSRASSWAPPTPETTAWNDPAASSAFVAPTPDDQTTLIPTFRADDGPSRSPILIAAGAMVAIGVLGLLAVLAISLGGSAEDGEAAAPLLPDPNAPTEAGVDQTADGAPTTLTPLAMLPSSTTTTLPDEMVTSTDTTIRRVTVPSLVNLDVSVAGQQLSDIGFEVLVVGRVSPGSIPGTVIQQTPAPGSTIELPATVTLFIPRSSTLPSMVGRPADTVCLQLTALGLRCEQTLRFNDQVAAGAVIATQPTEGSAFTDGQTIRLDVSRGPLTEARVPLVTGLSEGEARTALGGAGFIAVSTASVASDDVPAGQAIGTDPAAGTSLAIDQAVVIQLSSGPAPMVMVPELVGLDRAGAEAALQRAQLAGTFLLRDLPANDPNIGRVITSDPGAATQVAAGSTVTVTIGQAAAGSTTTTTAPSMTTSTMADGG